MPQPCSASSPSGATGSAAAVGSDPFPRPANTRRGAGGGTRDRKSTRLNSSHDQISYAVFCLKKKTNKRTRPRRNQRAEALPKKHEPRRSGAGTDGTIHGDANQRILVYLIRPNSGIIMPGGDS